MKELFLVFFGGGLGAGARFLTNVQVMRWAAERFSAWPAFPFGVMLINITGSLAMGLVTGYFVSRTGGLAQDVRLFLATGILGGYTTFSAFSLDTVNLIERGDLGPAMLYVGGSVVLSVLGLFLGLYFMRALT